MRLAGERLALIRPTQQPRAVTDTPANQGFPGTMEVEETRMIVTLSGRLWR